MAQFIVCGTGVLNRPSIQRRVTATVADPLHIFVIALKANANLIILSHNHPSVNLKPSEGDIDVTQKIKQAGAFLNINLLDHLLISPDRFCSFSD
ncbi:MAG: repair protein [Chitinophagaceae bacterium]|nr:repair protein [Chitinophagaceae bacterium]